MAFEKYVPSDVKSWRRLAELVWWRLGHQWKQFIQTLCTCGMGSRPPSTRSWSSVSRKKMLGFCEPAATAHIAPKLTAHMVVVVDVEMSVANLKYGCIRIFTIQ